MRLSGAESIVPYVQAPESVVPGKPQFYATSVPIDGYGFGVLVKSDMGRPIKIEGNPDHPASLGAADSLVQASLLSLYDPDRSQLVTHNGQIDTWEHFQAMAIGIRTRLRAQNGGGLRILTGTVTSPTLAGQLGAIGEQFPEAKWHSYEPVTRDAIRAGCRLAFGEDLEPIYHFGRAEVVLALDADFLGCGPEQLKAARDFAARREPGETPAPATMNRLYAVECTPSLTGAAADHRLAVPSRNIVQFARALASELSPENPPAHGDSALPERLAQTPVGCARARDLEAPARNASSSPAPPSRRKFTRSFTRSIIGSTTPARRSNSSRALNAGPSDQVGSLRELVRDMRQGVVDTLLILGGNPVFDAPADLGFAHVMASNKTPLLIHLGLYHDETAELCHWHIPEAHALETWSDSAPLMERPPSSSP